MQHYIKLQLTSVGWTDGFAMWRVRNLNEFNIYFNWSVYETGQVGMGLALAKYDVFFQTILTKNPNTVRITVNNIQQNVKTARLNSSSYCCIEPLPEPLFEPVQYSVLSLQSNRSRGGLQKTRIG